MRAAAGALILTAALLLAAAPPSSAQELGFVAKEDAKGDVKAQAGDASSPAVPEAEITSYLDLREVKVMDVDEETLEFRISAGVPFRRMTTEQLSLVPPEETFHQILFDVPGVAPVPAMITVRSAHFRVENNTPVTSGFLVVRSSLCFLNAGGASQTFCEYGFETRDVPVSIDDGTLVLSLEKRFLTQAGQEGQRSRAANLPGQLFAGDTIGNLFVQSAYRVFLSHYAIGKGVRLTDRVPDSGSLQVQLRYSSPANDLRMSVPAAAVILGQETQVPVLVQNLGSHKRLLNLSAQTIGAASREPWTVSITPSVTLGAGKSTNVTLRVRPPPTDEPRLFATIKLRATILSEPGTIAIAKPFLVAVPPLDGDHNTFMVWGRPDTYGFGPIRLFDYGHGGLTRSEGDRRFATSSPFPMSGGSGYTNSYTAPTFATDLDSDPIPNPVSVRKGEPLEGVVEIDTPYPATASITLRALFGERLIFEQQKTQPVVAGRTKVPFSAPLLPGIERLDPTNGTIKIQIRMTIQGSEAPGYILSYWYVNQPKLVPKSTQFRFPFEREFPAVEGTKAKIVLAATEELESFLNPGRIQVFELDLRNEEPRAMDLGVEALNVSEGWSVDVQPGTTFRLDSQDAVHIGILVAAPTGAQEGDVLKFRVVARELENNTLVAGQWIRAIVTRGVDIENETFEVAKDDARKLKAPDARSPGPVGAWIVAAALFGAAFRRRLH